MSFTVTLHDEFEPEFDTLGEKVQDAILAASIALSQRGPLLGRPLVDTLKGSKHANMKELRISVPDGEWRVAFAFDRKREAVLLVGASKSGVSSQVFYKRLIRTADMRLDAHLKKPKTGAK